MRVTAMLMIVLYHCLCYNAGLWSSFDNQIQYGPIAVAGIYNVAYVGLETFVFISGLLYYRIGETGKYDDIKIFLANKAERLLIPYIVWGLLLCIIFIGREYPIKLLYGISHLWFLLMLFEVFVIIAFTKCLWKKLSIKQSCIILAILMFLDGGIGKLGIIPDDGKGKVLLALQSTFDYLPIFYLGMMTEKTKLYKDIAISDTVCVSLIVILFALGSLLFAVHLPLSRLYKWLPTYILIVTTYSYLNKELPSIIGGGKLKKLLMLLDRYSLPIYIVHHILIFVYYDYLPNSQSFMTAHYIFAPLIMFIVLVPLSLGISIALSYLPKAKYLIGVAK